MAGARWLFSVSPWVSFTVAGSEHTPSTLQPSSWVEGWKEGDGDREKRRNEHRMGYRWPVMLRWESGGEILDSWDRGSFADGISEAYLETMPPPPKTTNMCCMQVHSSSDHGVSQESHLSTMGKKLPMILNIKNHQLTFKYLHCLLKKKCTHLLEQ